MSGASERYAWARLLKRRWLRGFSGIAAVYASTALRYSCRPIAPFPVRFS